MVVELIVILAVTAVATRSVGSKVIDGMHALRGTESERMKKWRQRHGPDFKPSGFSRYMDEAWASKARKRAEKDADRAAKRAKYGYTPGPKAWGEQLWSDGWDRAIQKHHRRNPGNDLPATAPDNGKSENGTRSKSDSGSADPWWARVHMPRWQRGTAGEVHDPTTVPASDTEPAGTSGNDRDGSKEETGEGHRVGGTTWSPWSGNRLKDGADYQPPVPFGFSDSSNSTQAPPSPSHTHDYDSPLAGREEESYQEALKFARRRAANAEEAKRFATTVARHATEANETLRRQLQRAKAREELFGRWWREHKAKQAQGQANNSSGSDSATGESSTVIDGEVVTDPQPSSENHGPPPQLDANPVTDGFPINHDTNNNDTNQQEDTMTNTNPQNNTPAQPSGGEIGTVGKATAFVSALQVQFDNAASAIEHAQSDLASSGVTGSLLEALGTVREYCTSANAALARASSELQAHASVGEHYRATTGAGEKAYVTGE